MKWIANLFVGKINEFNAENVRKLNTKHIDSFTKEQNKYKNKLCKEIVDAAKIEKNEIFTDEVGDEEWLTEKYLIYLKEYFESKDFRVYECNDYGELYLKIVW